MTHRGTTLGMIFVNISEAIFRKILLRKKLY